MSVTITWFAYACFPFGTGHTTTLIDPILTGKSQALISISATPVSYPALPRCFFAGRNVFPKGGKSDGKGADQKKV